MLAGSFQLHDKDIAKMPVYQLAIKRDNVQDPDVRWTHLSDDEAARRFANLLVKEFVSSGRYAHSSRSHLEVKDDSGGCCSQSQSDNLGSRRFERAKPAAAFVRRVNASDDRLRHRSSAAK
jgi:hypothetical protein